MATDDLKAATGKLARSKRFKIETYHKVLKSGCRAEQSKLRTAERLTNLLAVLCVVAWRSLLADDDEPGDARGPGGGRPD